ncbi:MAG: nucleoside recognition domain-containing protein [Salibacteraceae bacterium]
MGYIFRDYLETTMGWVFTEVDLQVFSDMVRSTFDMADASIGIVLYLMGVMTLWLGFMKIGEDGGSVQKLSSLVSPFFRKLFPEIPKNHPVTGSIMMNFAANMLGLDNSATPMGLKAMNGLQELNTNKEEASNSMIMFLVLNTSGLTIVPISVMAYRAQAGAANPTDVFIPILIATYFATVVGLITVSIYQRINLLKNGLAIYLIGITSILGLTVYGLMQLPKASLETVTSVGGNFILLSIIVTFFILAFKKKVNVYESFIEGAKEGFKTTISIIPYLVGMLVAIGVFRASGTMEYVIDGMGWLFASIGINTDFVPALPTAFMKPLSGSGARGMMLETYQHYESLNLGYSGADHFVSKMASIFQGSTETTFYTIAVYYGAINIKKTRYTVQAGLLADLAGIIAAIFIGYIFFH